MKRLLLLLAACTGPAPGELAAPRALDHDAYARDVHPILEARCATLDCHGRFERPFRLYAETGRRRSDELRDQAITAAELDDDVAAASTTGEASILDKAFARMKHTGGAVWIDGDAQSTCVRGWLEDTSAQVAAACAIAAEQTRLPP